MRCWTLAAMLAGWAAPALTSPAAAQLGPRPGGATGAVNATTLSSAPAITHPATGTVATPNTDATADTLPTGNSSGLAISRLMTMTTTGSGNVTLPGHAIGAFGQFSHAGTGVVALGIGSEGISVNTSTGTVTHAVGTISHMNTNTGTMTEYNGFDSLFDTNTGTVGTLSHYKCEVTVTGTLTGQNNCLNNVDPAAAIRTMGQVINSTGQEVAPAPAYPGLGSTRYHFGVQPAGTLNPLNVGATFIWFAPWTNPSRVTMNHIGTNVTTGATGGLCQVALYAVSGAGVPSLLLNSSSLTATAAGLQDYAIAGGRSLDAGLYETAVWCNASAIATSSYVEQAALAVYGSGVTSGALAMDTTAVQGGGTFGSWPATASLSFIAAGGVQPLIYLHQ